MENEAFSFQAIQHFYKEKEGTYYHYANKALLYFDVVVINHKQKEK